VKGVRGCHLPPQFIRHRSGKLQKGRGYEKKFCRELVTKGATGGRGSYCILVKEGGAGVGPHVVGQVVGPPSELVEEKHEGVHEDHDHEDGDHDDERREPEEEGPDDLDEGLLLRGSFLRRHCRAGEKVSCWTLTGIRNEWEHWNDSAARRRAISRQSCFQSGRYPLCSLPGA